MQANKQKEEVTSVTKVNPREDSFFTKSPKKGFTVPKGQISFIKSKRDREILTLEKANSEHAKDITALRMRFAVGATSSVSEWQESPTTL
jgi:hypothetical protein